MIQPPAGAGIPQSLSDTLGGREDWRELFALLKQLAADPPLISDAQLHAGWDGLVATLATSCEAAGGILAQVLACIGRHRPEMVDAILTDALDPLFCLELDEADAILHWYETNRHLDAQTKAWIRDDLPAYLARFDFASLDFSGPDFDDE